jgi:hypothetical protein
MKIESMEMTPSANGGQGKPGKGEDCPMCGGK